MGRKLRVITQLDEQNDEKRHDLSQRRLSEKDKHTQSDFTRRMSERIENREKDRHSLLGRIETAKDVFKQKTRSNLPFAYYLGDLSCISKEEFEEAAKKRHTYSKLDFKGRYHLSRIKNKFAIPGTQINIEREREMAFLARIKIIENRSESIAERAKNKIRNKVKTSSSPQPNSCAEEGRKRLEESRESSISTGILLSRVNYQMDQISGLLEEKTQLLTNDLALRKYRLQDAQCTDKALNQFWRLLHKGNHGQAKQMIVDKLFTDVNSAVVYHPVKANSTSSGNPPSSFSCIGYVSQYPKDLAQTPLMFACTKVLVDVVECLLVFGADPTRQTATGNSAMLFVFKEWPKGLNRTSVGFQFGIRASKCTRVIELLLEYGADPNNMNSLAETPLHFCAKYGMREAVDLLLKNGADAFLKDRTGRSAVDYANETQNHDLEVLLLNSEVLNKEKERFNLIKHQKAQLKIGRGTLGKEWSDTPDNLLLQLKNADRRSGQTRGQYLDPSGKVIVCE